MEIKKHLPNAITIARLLVACVVFYMVGGSRLSDVGWVYLDVACGLFAIAMATDWLDGFLARKYGATSKLGRMLDPFVDKFLICGVFLLFSYPEWRGDAEFFSGNASGTGIEPWMVLVIVFRELMVSMLRGMGESAGQDFSAKYIGKVKLCFQTGLLIAIFVILAHMRDQAWVAYIRDLGIVGAIFFTIVSAVPYVRMALKSPL